MAVSLSFSNQSALTDQDIVRFLLTPVGALSGLIVVSLLIVSMVLDVAVMTALLQSGTLKPVRSLQLAAHFALQALPTMLRFAFAFLFRIVMISAPFMIVSGLIAAVLLQDFDINYYLTNRPPGFLAAIGLVSGIILILAVLILQRLISWAIALHLVVFSATPVSESFSRSANLLWGQKYALLRRLFWWIVIRIVIVGFVATFAGFAVDFVTKVQSDNFRRTIFGLVVVGIFWSAASALIN